MDKEKKALVSKFINKGSFSHMNFYVEKKNQKNLYPEYANI